MKGSSPAKAKTEAPAPARQESARNGAREPEALSPGGESLWYELATGGAAMTATAGGRRSSPFAAPFGVIVEDGSVPGPGQVRRTDFMEALGAGIERVAEAELATAGHSARDCPYLAYWLHYYRDRPAADIERAIQRYAQPDQSGVAGLSVAGLNDAVLARVRRAVQAWIRSGGREVQAPGDALVLYGGRWDGGQPLDSSVRGRMEQGLGESLGDVRIHTGDDAARSAAGLSARAFTAGRDIVFGADAYRPGSPGGDFLLAHELAHTLQQRGSPRMGGAGRGEEASANVAALRATASIMKAPAAPVEAWVLQNGAALESFDGHNAAHETGFAASGLRLQRCSVLSDPDQRYAGPRTIPVSTAIDSSYSAANQPVTQSQPTLLHGGGWEMAIDADGDQSKELTVRFFATGRDKYNQPTGFRMEVQPIWGVAAKSATFDLTGVWFQMFVPRVQIVGDGHSPTEFSLFEVNSLHRFMIDPPRRATAGTVDYLARLDLSNTSLGPGAQTGQQHTFSFAGSPPQTFNIFEVGAPQRLVDLWALDVRVGPYRDPFRLSFGKPNPAGDATILGISGLDAEGPVGAQSTQFPLHGPLTTLQVLSSTGAALVVDLNGDGQADVTLYDRISTDPYGPPGVAANKRAHLFTVVPAGSSLDYNAGNFGVENGRMEVGSTAGSEPAFQAASQAKAVSGGINEQGRIGNLATELRLIESTQIALRQRAAQAGLISRQTYNSWAALSADIAVVAAIGATAVTEAFRHQAGADARAFYASFAADAQEYDTTLYRPGGQVISNPYTTREQFYTGTIDPSSPGDLLAEDIEAQRWDLVRTRYQNMLDGMDKMIAERARNHPEITEPLGMLTHLSGLHSELTGLESHHPTRVSAVFHSQAQFVQEGIVREMPLSLYYWRDGDTWHVRDVTNPDDVFNKDRPAAADETEPPIALFARLEEGSHFPRGWIYFRLPSGAEGRVETTGPSEIREWLGYGATALAIGGFILATGGTGTVAVVGGWAMATGAVIGASLAAVDLYERIRDDNLSAAPVVLDIAQIAATVTGLSAAKFGRLAMGARAAALEGTPLVGTAARMASWADRLLLPVVATNVAADVVTLGVVAKELAGQYDALDSTISDPDTRRRAKMALLTQGAVTGFFTVLSLRGNIPSLFRGRVLELEFTRGSDGSVVPIAWPVLKPVDPEVTALFSEPRFQTLFTAEPALRAQLEANPRLIEVLATQRELRDLLLARPSVLKSLLAHPDAIPMLREAVNRVSVQRAGTATPAATPAAGVTLAPAERGTSARMRILVDPSGDAQPNWRPPHGSAAQDGAYLNRYVDGLYSSAAAAQSELEAFATALANRTRGTAEFRPGPKDRARSLDKIRNDYGGDASRLNDLAAGRVTYATINDLFQALDQLSQTLGSGSGVRLVRFNDRISTPEASGYADIQMNLRMSNGHVAEFRLELRAVQEFAATEHALYEVRRSFEPVAAEANRPLTPEETALRLELEQLTRQGYLQALQMSAAPAPGTGGNP